MDKRYFLVTLLILLVRLSVSQTVTITGINNICAGQSTILHAEVTGGSQGTTSYNFEQFAYTPEAFTGGTGIQFAANQDDQIAGPFDIGFTFCFFNQSYTQFYIGSNGWVGFSYNSAWTTFTAAPIPNTNASVPKNCIMAPWQDWWPGWTPVGTGGTNVYYYLTGSPPNQKLVVYWISCPLYNCTGAAQKGTFQIVLNEQNSIIENHIQSKPNCSPTENATQGVHNIDGTVAFTATDRNCQPWTATNESTRFVPSGIIWYKDDLPPTGIIVGYGPDVTLSPLTTTTYYAVVGGCNGGSVSDSRTVTVNPVPPDPTITGLANVCQGSTILYTTEAGWTGYVWAANTGTIVSMTGNTAAIQWNLPGLQNLSVTYKSAEGCFPANPGQLPVTVNSYEAPVITGIDAICAEEEAAYSTQPGKSNYLWSHPGATLVSGGGTGDNTVTLKWMTGGAKTVSVNYTDAGGCTALVPVIKTVNVNPKPMPFITGLASLCISQTAINYTTEAGNTNYLWTYSAGAINVSGQGTNSITLDWAASGPQWLKVGYTNSSTCTGTSNEYDITVNPLPVLNFPVMPALCVNASPIVLNMATPPGGTYSGPGVVAGTFDPAAAGSGTHTITYTFTDANSCTSSTTSTILVNPLPSVAIQPLPPVCVTAAPILLSGGSPAGGTYSGPGVVAGIFNPATAGAGTHPITYSYTDINGCSNSTSANIVVNPLPVVAQTDFPDVCIGSPPFLLSGGTPAGGGYTGPGVSGGSFNPAAAGIGIHPVTYTYTDANGCTSSAQKNITVNGLPDVDFTGTVAPATVCQDYPTPSRYQVPSTPSAVYTWTIPAPYSVKGTITPVVGSPNMVDVTWTGTGAAQLKLEAITGTGCQDSKIKNIIINPKPVVALSACFDVVTTTNAKPFLLKGGTPLGNNGKYYINGTLVSGQLLDPGTLLPGSHTVLFTYTNTTGCEASDSRTLTVLPSNAGYQCFNGIFTDPRNSDGATNRYPTLSVTSNGRTTCWMLKNLNWGATQTIFQAQTDNCTVERYCEPGDNTCAVYGSFFQWDELMQYGSTPGWPKGVCPPGWHIPTATDWQDLSDANQGNGQAAGTLKDQFTPQGFHALLGGLLYLNNRWAFTSTSNLPGTMFWTSTQAGSKPIARGLNIYNPSVSIYESSRANAFPVRCVKD